MKASAIAGKTAAATFPEVNFVLIWKQDGEWFEQEVLS